MTKQQRGPITEYLGWLDDGRALCECVHGKVWPEGDRFEDAGGKACRECFEAWMHEHAPAP